MNFFKKGFKTWDVFCLKYNTMSKNEEEPRVFISLADLDCCFSTHKLNLGNHLV